MQINKSKKFKLNIKYDILKIFEKNTFYTFSHLLFLKYRLFVNIL